MTSKGVRAVAETESPLTPQQRLLRATVCSSVPILGIAAHDAIRLHGLFLAQAESLRGAAAGVSLMAIVTIPVAVICALSIGRPLIVRLQLARKDSDAGIQLLLPLCMAIAVGVLSFLMALAAQSFLASTRARRVFLSLALFGTSWLLLTYRETVESWLRRRLAKAPPTAAIWLGTAALATGLTAVTIVAWPILRQLSWLPIVSVGLCFAAAFVGALLPRLAPDASRWKRLLTRWLPAPLLVLLAILGGHGLWHAKVGMSNRMRLALKLTPAISAWTLRKVQDTGALGQPFKTSADRSAVCFEGSAPPSLRAVKPLGSDMPDVVVIVVDALRWDHTSLSGYARDTTPQLARHAATAAVFERAYSLASTTQESYRGIFTGVYASKVHFVGSSELKWGMGFTPAQVTWAEMYRKAGFETFFISPERSIFSRADGALDGFEEVDESPSVQRKTTGHTVDFIVDHMIARLQQQRSAGRFLWTHVMEAHQPYHAGTNPVKYGEDETAKYDAAIHFADQHIGRLLDYALAPERRKNTWVVVTADHGQALQEHGNRFHGRTVYEEEIHVPLLIWGPSVKPRRIQAATSLIDLMPTALDMVGIDVPEALCGESLKPALAGKPLAPRVVYAENTPDKVRAIFSVALIDGRNKTILSPIDRVKELYDLKSDPREKKNLAQSQPERHEQQLNKLRAFHAKRGLRSKQYGL